MTFKNLKISKGFSKADEAETESLSGVSFVSVSPS